MEGTTLLAGSTAKSLTNELRQCVKYSTVQSKRLSQQTHHRCTTDDYGRTLLSSCIRLIKHKLLPQRLCNIFQLDSGSYHLRKREFVPPRFSSVTYRKHSSLPRAQIVECSHSSNKKSTLFEAIKSVIRNHYLTTLTADVSDYRGCNLCSE